MQALIARELEAFADARGGAGTWRRLTRGQEDDAAQLGVVLALSQQLDVPLDAVLEDVGAWVVPGFMSVYQALIEPGWDALDVLGRIDELALRASRVLNPQAQPPSLRSRVMPDGVVITYGSARQLCPVVRGVIRGFGEHFGEQLLVLEPRCMRRGDPVCELEVRAVQG